MNSFLHLSIQITNFICLGMVSAIPIETSTDCAPCSSLTGKDWGGTGNWAEWTTVVYDKSCSCDVGKRLREFKPGYEDYSPAPFFCCPEKGDDSCITGLPDDWISKYATRESDSCPSQSNNTGTSFASSTTSVTPLATDYSFCEEVLAVYQCEYLRGQCDGEPSNSYCQQLQECCGESFTTTTGKSETSQESRIQIADVSEKDISCFGMPFGTSCNHAFGYCDNNICINFPIPVEQKKCDPQQEFCCKDGEGIEFDWKCDGENDCMDGEDEAQCGNSEVLAY